MPGEATLSEHFKKLGRKCYAIVLIIFCSSCKNVYIKIDNTWNILKFFIKLDHL